MNVISKLEARNRGLKTYFTGKLCKRGHLSSRLVSSSVCCTCASIDGALNRKLNYNKRIQWQQEYKEVAAAKAIRRYKDNTTAIKQSAKQWRQDNPHKVIEHNRLRYTTLRRSIPLWYEDDKVYMVYHKRNLLNRMWGVELEVDHIIPLAPRDKSVCGLHCWDNLQLLDADLNNSKRTTYQTDW